MDKQFSGAEVNLPSVYGETMEWKTESAREIFALVEKCVMSTIIGIKGLFDAMPDCRHTLHIFQNHPAFYKAALKTPFLPLLLLFR